MAHYQGYRRDEEGEWQPTLSFQDDRWVEAIARRAMIERGWSHWVAHREAEREVKYFYEQQKYYWGYVDREAENQLETKRLVYEAETARLEQEREVYLAEERARRKRQRAIAEQMQPLFDAAGGRDKWIFQERKAGRTITDIAKQMEYSWGTIGNIVHRQNHKAKARWRDRIETLKRRPLDIGGPRDVWLTYNLGEEEPDYDIW